MHSQHHHFNTSYADYWPGPQAGHGFGLDEWHERSRRSDWPRPGMRGGLADFMHGPLPHLLFDAFSRDFPTGPPSFNPFPPHGRRAGRMHGFPHPQFPMNGPEGGNPPLEETFDDKLNLDDDPSAKCTCADPEKCECDASKLEKGKDDDNANNTELPAGAPRPSRGRGGHFRGGRGRGRGGFGGCGMSHFGPRGPPPFPFDETEGLPDFPPSRGRGRGGHHHRGSPRMRGGHAPPYPTPHAGPPDCQDTYNFCADPGFVIGIPPSNFSFGHAARRADGARSRHPFSRGFGPWAVHWREARDGDGEHPSCPTCGCTGRHHEAENGNEEPADEEMHDAAEDDAVAQQSSSKGAERAKGD